MNIILFGPPGAGKGTQAQIIVRKHNYFQLSTGDLLRAETQKNSPLSSKIEKLISNGQFVSDEIVNNLLRKTISDLKFRDRIIFDGYPRSIKQAKDLEVILNEFEKKIELIISLNVSREIIKKRIMGRITCKKCNLTLNEYFNNEEIKLHPCGEKFFTKRKDDNLDTIISRYDKYVETTKPVLEFLSKKIRLEEIDGTLKIDLITAKIDEIINV